MISFIIKDVFNFSQRKETVFVIENLDGKLFTEMSFKLDGEIYIIKSIEIIDGKLDGDWVSNIALKVEPFLVNLDPNFYIGKEVIIQPGTSYSKLLPGQNSC